MTHIQPQGSVEICCCSGSGEYVPSCSCFAWGNSCSIGWVCYYPFYPNTTIPTLAPALLRIIREDDPDPVVIVSSNALTHVYQVPEDTNAEFAVQYCCELVSGICNWVDLWRGTINNIVTPCTLSVAGGLYYITGNEDGPNSCGSFLRVVGAANTEFGSPGIVKLEINGVVVYSGSAVSSLGCLPGDNSNVTCNSGPYAGSWNCSPPQPANDFTGTYYVDIPYPVSQLQNTVLIKATNADGTVQACSVVIPCHWSYNAVRIEVPTWTGLNLSCSGMDAKPPNFDSTSPSLIYWRQNWETEVTLTGSLGGSYLFYSCDDGVSKTLTTGTFTYTYTETGRVKYYNPATPGTRLEGDYSRVITFTGTVTYSLLLTFSPGYTNFTSQAFLTNPIFSPGMSLVGAIVAYFTNNELTYTSVITDPANAYKPTIGGAGCGYDTEGTFTEVLTYMYFDNPYIMGITDFGQNIDCSVDNIAQTTIEWSWYTPFYYAVVRDTPSSGPEFLCYPPVTGTIDTCIDEGTAVLNTETLVFAHLLLT